MGLNRNNVYRRGLLRRMALLTSALGTPFLIAARGVFAQAHEAEKIAVVTSLSGSAGVAGEPRRQELTVDSALHAGKLVILDRASTLVLTYQPSGEAFELSGPGLFLVQPGVPLVVEGAAAKKR